ncbi:MAG: DMT family transporter [Rhodocyclaceae bacterium]
MNKTTSRAERWQGVAWIVISAIGFGAMAIFAKIAYAAGVTLATMLFLRFLIAGLLLASWGVSQGKPWPRGRDLLWVTAMGAVGYVGQAFCYFSALKYASAGLVSLLLYLYPAIVTLMAALLYRRRIGTARIIAVAAALTGTAMTVGGDLTSQPLGIALGIGAALIYSLYILAGDQVIPRIGPLPAATVVTLAAAVVFGVAAAAEGPMLPRSWQGWLAVLAIAIFSTSLAILGFFKGLEKLGASDAATLSTFEPLITIALAYVVLGETVTSLQLAGGALILVAVIYLARHGRQDDESATG